MNEDKSVGPYQAEAIALVRHALDTVDGILAGENRMASKLLWDILAGSVRGPDNGNMGDKLARTVPCRNVAFPQTAQRADLPNGAGPSGAFFGEFETKGARGALDNNALTLDYIVQGHYDSHVVSAWRALRTVRNQELLRDKGGEQSLTDVAKRYDQTT